MFRKTTVLILVFITIFFTGFSQKPVVSNSDKPAEVVLTPYKTTLLADGKDKAIIKVTIVDREGNAIPDAGNLIEFVVTGDAQIIQIEKGDSGKGKITKVAAENAKKTSFNGASRVTLQAGKSAGHIKFKATSKGLWDEVQILLP